MSFLYKHISNESFTMSEMSCKAYISDQRLVFGKLQHVSSVIRGFESLVKIMLPLFFFIENGSVDILPILLFNHNFCFRIHLLMSLIIFFILMKHYSMLIGALNNIAINLLILFFFSFLLFFRL